MATASGGTSASLKTVEERLLGEGFAFDFFQAVRLLERLLPDRRPVGHTSPPRSEIVRFRAHVSLSFPPSSIYDIVRPADPLDPLQMIVAFFGLTGPSGVLPRHYTELLLRQAKEAKGSARYALRDWLDLFNHRLISLFYRAWEKYRFYIPYERGDYRGAELDPFTRTLFSLVGLGEPALRGRLRVSVREESEEQPVERVLAGIDDLCLLHYSGFLAQRPRSAVSLAALLQNYFQLPLSVEQFRGQWLTLETANQSRLGEPGNNCLGLNLVAGNRVWDVQGKFRIRIGALGYTQFTELLPDRAPERGRKAFFLLVHLVRLYVGPEYDFDVQLVLQASDVPACQMVQTPAFTPRLGWNTWITSGPLQQDADDAVFEAEEVRWLAS
jgi:type VI secretion system protein ImpH